MSKRRSARIHGLLFALLTATGAGLDLDVGKEAIGFDKMVDGWELSGADRQSGWIRLRGADLNKLTETRDALLRIRARGLKTCIMLRGPEYNWKTEYLPKDLRSVYEHARKLGRDYGEFADAWEIDNEPDLGFVPEGAEKYTAFLKAHYLGLKAGVSERNHSPNETLVIMGALGLPPGPWLEMFAANGGFDYTEGYTYHYYGYADDFTGVYRQHETAAAELSRRFSRAESRLVTGGVVQKSLPVFVTEIGYGMLSKQASNSKEGRLRQWQWFKSVAEQAATLRIEAPLAFYLPPFFDGPSRSEFGLTVAPMQARENKKRDAANEFDGWVAGAVQYVASDFQSASGFPTWIDTIGKQVGGNEVTPALAWWLQARVPSVLNPALSNHREDSRSWCIESTIPSPVVIDFHVGKDLAFIKRYNGSFVVGKSEGTGQFKMAPGNAEPIRTEKLKPAITGSVAGPIPRSEEFIIHVRTQNGNLYEVYPTRMATKDWQHFLEPQENFTMSFYGRAELPWRFSENKPVSLLVVMYPKQLPATFEFRRPQLLRLGEMQKPETGNLKPEGFRYGRGSIVLYNFSEKAVVGKLQLPEGVSTETPEYTEVFELSPGERRVVEVSIKVPADRYQRIDASILFVPEDAAIPPARFVTSFMPDIAGMRPTVVGEPLRNMEPETGDLKLITPNMRFLLERWRTTEEVAGVPSSGFRSQVSGFTYLAQPGAMVEETADGFAITVMDRIPGKVQRIEVEIPWVEGLPFGKDEFLSMEFRLRP